MNKSLHIISAALLIIIFSQFGYSQCTNPTIPLPDASTPVNGSPATAYCTTFTFDPSLTGIPTGLQMQLQHTWQGDLSIFIQACGNTLMVMNRPGVTGSCTGGCPCGNSNDIGSTGSPVPVSFTTGGGPDPENGIAQGGGSYGITADNSCGVSTVSTFAALWAGCPPGPITATVCIADHAGADVGVAANVTLIYPNPVICGCTNPNAPNYNPNATVDDGSCIPGCSTLMVSASASSLSVCAGSTVSLNSNVSGYPGPYTYTWSGADISFLSNPSSPNPTVTIPVGFSGVVSYILSVGAGPCLQNTSVSIVVNSPTPPTIIGPPGICPNQSASLFVSGAYSTYSWSVPPGGSGPNITVNQPGTYNVTVTDPSGCPAVGSFTLNQYSLPVPQITGPATICTGQTVELDAGPGFNNYVWTPGGPGQSIFVNSPGVYAVAVTNAEGCTGVGQFTLTQAPSPTIGIFGGDQICPNTPLTLSAEFGYSNIIWSNGTTGPTTDITMPGVYTVSGTDVNGCTGTGTITVTSLSAPQPIITGDLVLCPGEQSVLSVAPIYLAYQWSNGQFGPSSITVTQPGTYSITATTMDGCTVTSTQTVTSATAPIPFISGDLSVCPGQNAVLSVQTGFSSYQWSEGTSGPLAVVPGPGTYTVTVTNSAGCSGTDVVTVSAAPVPAPIISGPSQLCPGASASLNAGPGYSSYAWSTSSNAQQININAPGNYIVTVTNADGCPGTTTLTVTAAPVPNPTISGNLAYCAGTSTTLNAGPGFSTYAWTGGGSGQTLTVNTPGTYAVTVTNSNGCSNSASVAVTSTPNPVPALTGPANICPGNSATLGVSGTFNTYNWSTGANTPTINTAAAGTYTVTVTNAAGCSGSGSRSVQLFTPPSPQISGPAQFCFGATATLNAGAGYTNYQWSSAGGSDSTLVVSNSGNYTVTVTDGNGCTGTDTLQITELPEVIPSVTGDNDLCAGQSSATLTATAGYVSYQWSNMQSGQQISVATGGTYTVTVTDGNGCNGVASAVVTANTPPTVAISGALQYCQGASTALSAGAGFQTYAWSTSAASSGITVNAPGNYAVTVTDNNGCTAQNSVTVVENPNPTPVISGLTQICTGGQTVLSAPAGFSNYAWSNSTSNSSVTVNTPGAYTVTVTDANGCSGTANVTVTQVPQLQPAITGTLYYCAGGNTVLDAGVGYATYNWSNSGSGQQLTVSAPGSYTVSVTDANGCSGQATVSITERPLPLPQITGPTQYCEGNSVALASNAAFSSYQWSTGATSQNINLSTPGAIGLTVTDAFGCVGATSVNVIEHPLVQPNITGNLSFCEGQQTVLDAGTGFVTYQWSNAAATRNITVNSGGNYSITVTDANGCVTNGSVSVIEFPVTAPQISGDLEFCAGENVVLTATPGYTSYVWSNSNTGQTNTISQGGFFSVTATDNNGCTSNNGVSVTRHPLPNVSIGGSASFCVGGFTTLNAGAGFVQYAWSNGTTGQTLQVSTPGTVSVTVTDSNGCSNSDDISITQDTELSPQISGPLQFCPGTQTTLDAGPGYATYQWSNSSGAQSVTVTQAGTYTVSVTDAFGCAGSGSVQVTNYPQPQPVIQGTPSFCVGNTPTLSSSAPFASYLWSSGSTQPQITVSVAGTYGLTVTDDNGCVASASQTVTTNPLPVFSINGDDFFCAGAATNLSVSGTFSGYLWTGGQQTQTISAGTPGSYSVTVTNQFGCVSSQAIQVAQVNLPISDAGPARELTCNNPTATLGGSGTSQGGGFSYLWSGPGITPANATLRQPQVNAPGAYQLVVTDVLYGCQSVQTSVNVADLTALPAISVAALDTLDCVTPSIVISGNGSATGANFAYQWLNAAGVVIPGANQLNYTAAQPGQYRLRVINTYSGCVSVLPVSVAQDIALPIAEAGTTRHLNCIITADALDGSGSASGPGMAYLWTSVGGNIVSGSTGIAPVINRPGLYVLRVTNQRNGCVSSDSVTVTQDIAVPTAVAGQDQEIDCLHPTVQINGTGSSTGAIMRYEWLRNGSTAVISNALALDVATPGTYTLRVVNTQNGCSAADLVIVAENPERPRAIQPVLDNPTCFGDTDGSILIGGVTGGTLPYLYSINGSALRAQTFYPNLGGGTYNIVVQDATGCELALEVSLPQGNDLALDLGPDQFINLGQRAQVQAQYNIPEEEVASFQWNAVDTLPCDGCLQFEVRPFNTVSYSATLVDSNGCRITNDVTIFVANPREVFIPNAFSPNNDGTNDRLLVFAGEDVAYVRSFLVFNRWGESVFEVYNFPPNDPAFGWDGNYRAQLYNSAVFAYFAEVEFIDGSVKLFKGDVTLIK
jgi:gliding motility-associated-like protein